MSGLLTLGPYRALSGPSSRPHPLIRTRSFGTEVCQEETNCPDLVGPHSIGSAFPRLSARLPTLLLLQRVRDHPESVAPRSCTSSGRRSKRSGSCHGHSRLLTRCTAQCDAPRDRSADILENLRGPTGVPFGPDRPCEVRGPEGQLRDGGRPHREFKIHSNRLTVHPKNAPHCVQLEWIGARLLGIGCQPQPMPKTHASAGHRD